jgi:hypothetical protein
LDLQSGVRNLFAIDSPVEAEDEVAQVIDAL